jgi:hypothetical protein
MNSLDQLQSADGLGPVGEVRVVPDLDTFRVLPYAPHCGVVLTDHITLDGSPAAVCQWSFLKRMQARLADAAGLQLRAASENEFSLANKTDGAYMRWSCGCSASGDVAERVAGAAPKSSAASSPVIATSTSSIAAGRVKRLRVEGVERCELVDVRGADRRHVGLAWMVALIGQQLAGQISAPAIRASSSAAGRMRRRRFQTPCAATAEKSGRTAPAARPGSPRPDP